MTAFLYTGPLSAATLSDGTEVVLVSGAVVELPEADPYTLDLQGLGRLAPVPAPPDPKPEPKPKKGGA